jgi:nitrogen-specific signal transduction histidine kinase
MSVKQDILENKSERVERTAKPEVRRTFQIAGQTIESLAVEDREFDSAGNLTDATLDYFAQGDTTDGCGLGLSVAQWIVSARGGKIQIASEPSKKPSLPCKFRSARLTPN